MSSTEDFSNSNSLLVNNMPTKMATCRKDKAVVITVYVEKPQTRASSNHHHYLHQTIRKEQIQHKHGGAAACKGYNRRAELLHYTQRLRSSARSASSAPLQTKPVSSDDRQPSNQIITEKRKPKYSKAPACFDNWETLIPTFLRSLLNFKAKKTGDKRKNGGSTSSNYKKIQKNWRLFFSKPMSMLQKHR